MKEACGCFTCASSSTNRNQTSPILCNGLDRQLVLTKWSLLHDGDGCHGSSLRGLNDATDSTHWRSCYGRNRLHFYYRGAEPHRLDWKTSPLCHCRHSYWFSSRNNVNSPLISWCSLPPFSWGSVVTFAAGWVATVAILTAGIWWTTCTVCIMGVAEPVVTMAGVAMAYDTGLMVVWGMGWWTAISTGWLLSGEPIINHIQNKDLTLHNFLLFNKFPNALLSTWQICMLGHRYC